MKKSRFFRAIAWLILVVFSFQSILEAGPMVSLDVPESWGEVSEWWQGKGEDNRHIILIEDAHDSFDAQKNLSKTIQDLNSQFEDAILIGMEGASQEVNVSSFRKYPIQEAREEVATQLLKEGYLTGAEHAAIVARKPMQLYGVENEELFQKDFKLFYWAQKNKDEIQTYLLNWDKTLENWKVTFLNESLQNFIRQFEKLDSTALKVNHLVEWQEKLEIDLSFNYFQLPLLLEIFKLQSFLQENLITQETKQLFLDLDFPPLKDLPFDENKFYEDLLSQAKREKKLNKYKELTKLDEIKRKVSLIDWFLLEEEIEFLFFTLQKELAENTEERDLISLIHPWEDFKKVLNLNATRFDFDKFDAFLIRRFREFSKNHGLSIPLLGNPEKFKTYQERVTSFYQLAANRDKYLISNLLQQMTQKELSLGALVVGGYHSSGIKEFLRKQKISYQVFRPSFDPSLEKVGYYDRLLGNLLPVSPALISYIKTSQINATMYEVAGDFGTESVSQIFGEEWGRRVEDDMDWASLVYLMRELPGVPPEIKEKADKIFIHAQVVMLMVEMDSITSQEQIINAVLDSGELETEEEAEGEKVFFRKHYDRLNLQGTFANSFIRLSENLGVDWKPPIAFIGGKFRTERKRGGRSIEQNQDLIIPNIEESKERVRDHFLQIFKPSSKERISVGIRLQKPTATLKFEELETLIDRSGKFHRVQIVWFIVAEAFIQQGFSFEEVISQLTSKEFQVPVKERFHFDSKESFNREYRDRMRRELTRNIERGNLEKSVGDDFEKIFDMVLNSDWALFTELVQLMSDKWAEDQTIDYNLDRLRQEVKGIFGDSIQIYSNWVFILFLQFEIQTFLQEVIVLSSAFNLNDLSAYYSNIVHDQFVGNEIGLDGFFDFFHIHMQVLSRKAEASFSEGNIDAAIEIMDEVFYLGEGLVHMFERDQTMLRTVPQNFIFFSENYFRYLNRYLVFLRARGDNLEVENLINEQMPRMAWMILHLNMPSETSIQIPLEEDPANPEEVSIPISPEIIRNTKMNIAETYLEILTFYYEGAMELELGPEETKRRLTMIWTNLEKYMPSHPERALRVARKILTILKRLAGNRYPEGLAAFLKAFLKIQKEWDGPLAATQEEVDRQERWINAIQKLLDFFDAITLGDLEGAITAIEKPVNATDHLGSVDAKLSIAVTTNYSGKQKDPSLFEEIRREIGEKFRYFSEYSQSNSELNFKRRHYFRLSGIAGWHLLMLDPENESVTWDEVENEFKTALYLTQPGHEGDLSLWLAMIPRENGEETKYWTYRYLYSVIKTGINFRETLLPYFAWEVMPVRFLVEFSSIFYELIFWEARDFMSVFNILGLDVRKGEERKALIDNFRKAALKTLIGEGKGLSAVHFNHILYLMQGDEPEFNLGAFRAELNEKRVDLNDIILLLTLFPYSKEPHVILILREIKESNYLQSKKDGKKYIRLLDEAMTSVLEESEEAAQILEVMEQAEQASRGFRFEDAFSLYTSLADINEKLPPIVDPYSKDVSALRRVWAVYQETGPDMSQKVALHHPVSAEIAMSMVDHIDEVEEVERLKGELLFVSAKNKAQKLLRGLEVGVDPYLESLLEQIKLEEQEMGHRFHLLREALRELKETDLRGESVDLMFDRFEKVRRQADDFHKNYPKHPEILDLKWELMRVFYERGLALVEHRDELLIFPGFPLGAADFFRTANELGLQLITIISKKEEEKRKKAAAAQNGPKGGRKANRKAAKKAAKKAGKVAKKQESPADLPVSHQDYPSLKGVEIKNNLAKAYLEIGTMALHHGVLREVVHSEAVRIAKLKGRKPSHDEEIPQAIRWNYRNLNPTQKGFMLSFSDIFYYNTQNPASIGSEIREGDTFRLYLDSESDLAIEVFFTVKNVNSQHEKIFFEVLDEKRNFDFSQLKNLPESGVLERMPDFSSWKQWSFLNGLLYDLRESTERYERKAKEGALPPSTGNLLVDRQLGLTLGNGAAPIPMIQGPPGTGKTTVIVSFLEKIMNRKRPTVELTTPLDESQLEALANMERLITDVSFKKPLKILVVSQQHAAVDNVLSRIIRLRDEVKDSNLELIRVGNTSEKIERKEVKELWRRRENLIRDARDNYESGNHIVVAGTINGFANDRFLRRTPFFEEFDLVIMEETGRATYAEALMPMEHGVEIVKIGDHFQLPPHGLKREDIDKILSNLKPPRFKREPKKKLQSGPRRARSRYERELAENQALWQEHKRREAFLRSSAIDIFHTSPFEATFQEEERRQRDGVRGQNNFAFSRLRVNRRSHPWLVEKIVNRFYGFLKPDPKKDPKPKWNTLTLRDVQGVEEKSLMEMDEYELWIRGEDAVEEGASLRNIVEVEKAVQEVDRLLNEKVTTDEKLKPEDINIISYYAFQVQTLQAVFRARAILHEALKTRQPLGQEKALTLERDLMTFINGTSYRGRIRRLIFGVGGGGGGAGLVNAANQEAILELMNIGPFNLRVPKKVKRIPTYQELSENPLFVSTVDSFQGNENKVIILSFVRTIENGKQTGKEIDPLSIGFLANRQRLNVSLSRMEERLILIGDFSEKLTKARYKPKKRRTHRGKLEEKAKAREADEARELFTELYALPKELALTVLSNFGKERRYTRDESSKLARKLLEELQRKFKDGRLERFSEVTFNSLVNQVFWNFYNIRHAHSLQEIQIKDLIEMLEVFGAPRKIVNGLRKQSFPLYRIKTFFLLALYLVKERDEKEEVRRLADLLIWLLTKNSRVLHEAFEEIFSPKVLAPLDRYVTDHPEVEDPIELNIHFLSAA